MAPVFRKLCLNLVLAGSLFLGYAEISVAGIFDDMRKQLVDRGFSQEAGRLKLFKRLYPYIASLLESKLPRNITAEEKALLVNLISYVLSACPKTSIP